MRRLLAISLALAFAGCARGNPAADFTLQTDESAPWSLSAQHGKAVVVSFGYTHCADTCPLTLVKLAKARAALGRARRRRRDRVRDGRPAARHAGGTARVLAEARRRHSSA